MLVSFVVFLLEKLACIIVTLKFEIYKVYVFTDIWLRYMASGEEK